MADNAKWYVVHTYSGYENAVKSAILKFVAGRHLEELIVDIQIPMEEVTEITESGESKDVMRKVFPGYVLIKMVMTDNTWHLVRNIRGVTGFVGEASNRPIPLTDEEARGLGLEARDEEPAAAGEEKRQVVVRYKVGDQIRINEGPFEDQSGVVQEILADKNKVVVLLSLFGRETPVELELGQVEVL